MRCLVFVCPLILKISTGLSPVPKQSSTYMCWLFANPPPCLPDLAFVRIYIILLQRSGHVSCPFAASLIALWDLAKVSHKHFSSWGVFLKRVLLRDVWPFVLHLLSHISLIIWLYNTNFCLETKLGNMREYKYFSFSQLLTYRTKWQGHENRLKTQLNLWIWISFLFVKSLFKSECRFSFVLAFVFILPSPSPFFLPDAHTFT